MFRVGHWLFIFLISSCNTSEYNQKAVRLYEEASLVHQYRRTDQALAMYQEAIRMDKDFYKPHLGRKRIFIGRGEYNKALLECELVIRKKPDLAKAWLSAGVLYEKLADTLTSQEYYQQSISLFENQVSLLQNLTTEDTLQLKMTQVDLAYALLLSDKRGRGFDILEELSDFSRERIDTMYTKEKVKEMILNSDSDSKKGTMQFLREIKES